MNINFNVDLEKLRQKQKQKTKTGMSMQATVNGALNLPTGGNQQPAPQQTKTKGWGSTNA